MRVAIIFLNYKRYELGAKVLRHNLANAGCDDFGLIVVDQRGLARAMNIGICKAIEAGYDAFMFLANDIYEPGNWLLKRIELLNAHPKAGIVSIPLAENAAGTDSKQSALIGNYLILKEVIDKVGGFDESFDPYGPIDIEFCIRAHNAGYEMWYVGGCQVEHAGLHGEAETSEIYGFNKREMIQKSWYEYQRRLTLPHYTIYQPQFMGE